MYALKSTLPLPLQLQQNHAEQWLHCVRRAFEDFDTDHDGVIALEEIIACLRSKLPAQEVGASPVPVRVVFNTTQHCLCGEAAAAGGECCSSAVWSSHHMWLPLHLARMALQGLSVNLCGWLSFDLLWCLQSSLFPVM